MNRSELVTLVSRQARVEPSIVDAVLDQTFELIALTLAVDEEVGLRGFGKFKPVHRSSTSLRNPRTGEPVPVGARMSARFTPSSILKKRLNGSGPL
jgi:nucleoid DNA-binding protein